MKNLDFITPLHTKTKRNYLERVVEHDKAKCAEVALKFDKDYWDGERQYGYGGYKYDGRWVPIAEKITEHYQLKAGSKLLDVGCGKGFLLYELTQVVPGIIIQGIDISEYGIKNSKEEVRPYLKLADATNLPFSDKEFDLVISLNTLHNLYNYDLSKALSEMERVATNKYLVVESYRNEEEKINLLYWQLTCRAFMKPEEWRWMMQQSGYTGDYGFIFFE